MSIFNRMFGGNGSASGADFNLDCLSIGDTVVDAFIRLQVAEELVDVEHHRDMLCMTFADKIPYEFAEVIPGVGNSANAAVALGRLGLSSGIYTNVGDDMYGQDCIKNFKDNHVSTDFVVVNKGMKTNYHYVLWFKNERTILIKHFEYPYVFPKQTNPRYIYLSSLGPTSLDMHRQIADFMKSHPETKLVFQPGTFQIKLGKDQLKDIYACTEIFFCNKEEAGKILGTDAIAGADNIKKLMSDLRGLGPKVVVVTDGPAGAYASNGTENLFAPPYPDPKEPYERTGAGDAFASTFTGALMKGKTLKEALQWGSVNSMSVVQDIGAQRGLLPQDKIEQFIKTAPVGWIVTEI